MKKIVLLFIFSIGIVGFSHTRDSSTVPEVEEQSELLATASGDEEPADQERSLIFVPKQG